MTYRKVRSMAEKGPGSTGRSAGKRLARAKIKPTDNGIKSSKGRAAAQQEELSKTQQKKARKQKITGIIIGVFAVLMALSMMLPSLTYIFGNNGAQPVEEQQEQAETTDDTDETDANTTDGDTADATGDATADTEKSDMDKVDDSYKAVVNPLKEKLEKNPEDLATLLNLGNDYMAWGSAAGSYASTDEDYEHITKLYGKAIEYFDSYLKLNDSAVVKTSRAMCLLYQGNTDEAIAGLEKVVEEHPDHGPAWADLGLIYEYQGQSDKAKESYQKAIEADADDAYGAKSYANRRLASMAASENGGLTDETAESSNVSSTSTDSGYEDLENALGKLL